MARTAPSASEVLLGERNFLSSITLATSPFEMFQMADELFVHAAKLQEDAEEFKQNAVDIQKLAKDEREIIQRELDQMLAYSEHIVSDFPAWYPGAAAWSERLEKLKVSVEDGRARIEDVEDMGSRLLRIRDWLEKGGGVDDQTHSDSDQEIHPNTKMEIDLDGQDVRVVLRPTATTTDQAPSRRAPAVVTTPKTHKYWLRSTNTTAAATAQFARPQPGPVSTKARLSKAVRQDKAELKKRKAQAKKLTSRGENRQVEVERQQAQGKRLDAGDLKTARQIVKEMDSPMLRSVKGWKKRMEKAINLLENAPAEHRLPSDTMQRAKAIGDLHTKQSRTGKVSQTGAQPMVILPAGSHAGSKLTSSIFVNTPREPGGALSKVPKRSHPKASRNVWINTDVLKHAGEIVSTAPTGSSSTQQPAPSLDVTSSNQTQPEGIQADRWAAIQDASTNFVMSCALPRAVLGIPMTVQRPRSYRSLDTRVSSPAPITERRAAVGDRLAAVGECPAVGEHFAAEGRVAAKDGNESVDTCVLAENHPATEERPRPVANFGDYTPLTFHDYMPLTESWRMQSKDHCGPPSIVDKRKRSDSMGSDNYP